jgi:ubiquinone/menaquinone biosynthesis C-methylase UbiE
VSDYLNYFRKSLREYYEMLGLDNIDSRIEQRVSRERSKKIVKNLDKYIRKDNLKILDVGCGWGEMQLEFQEWNKTGELFGIEPDDELYDISSKINPKIKHAFAEQIPFETGEFDLIIFNDVIEHVNSHYESLKEILRVTNKKEGYIYISFPNYRYPAEGHYKVSMLPYSCILPKWIYKLNLKINGRNPLFFDKYVNPICDYQFFRLLNEITKESNIKYEFISLSSDTKTLKERIFGYANIKGIIKLNS